MSVPDRFAVALLIGSSVALVLSIIYILLT